MLPGSEPVLGEPGLAYALTLSGASDSAGQVVTTTDGLGRATVNVYDGLGRLVRTIQDDGGLNLTTVYTYDLAGRLLETVSPAGLKTCYAYDDLDRRTAEIQDCGGLNLTTRTAYDLAGNVVTITDTRSVVTHYEYDALGRVTLERQNAGGASPLTTTYGYDAVGNLAWITDTRGAVAHLTYNNLNQLVSRCEDVGDLNLCTTYGYDQLGRQTAITDANGVRTATAYNAFDLPELVTQDDGEGPEHLQAKTVFNYDHALRLNRVKNANEVDTWYTLTANGQVKEEIYADGRYVEYTYDGRGNIVTQRLQDGQIITHTYDGAGRLTGKAIAASGRQTYTYDAGGRLTLAEETLDGHTTRLAYQYNALGDVISTTQTVSGTSWTVRYAYDYPGGVYTVTYPSGAVRRYELDALGRPDAVKDGGSAIADYVYTDTAGYATVAYGNGLTTRVEYDRLGRTTLITSPVGGYAYGYDGAGNRLWMQRQHKTGQPYDVYEYDALYQLTQAWYGAATTDPQDIAQREYALDLLGNRLWVRADGVAATYTLKADGMNRYSQAATTTLSYDARGNVLNDGLRGYGYDPLNRMTGAGSATYLYDAFGRRVAKTVGGATTFYVYDTQGRVLEEWRDGNWVSRYTYGAGVDEVLALETVTTTYYYHRDALGSITEISDASGNLVERYEYDVYGKPVIYAPDWSVRVVSIIGNRYLFTGREYDAETGNYFYRARYYSPRLGRFLSQDPIGYAAGDANLYRYVFNNSVNLVDPSGRILLLIAVAALGGLIGGIYYGAGSQIYRDMHSGTNRSFWDAYMNLNPRETALWTLTGGGIGTSFGVASAAASGAGLGVTVGGVGSNAAISAALAASASTDAAWVGIGSVIGDSVVGALLGAGGGLLNAGVTGTKYTWEQMRVDLGFGIFSGWFGNIIGHLDKLLNKWGVNKFWRFLSRAGISGAGNAGLNALQRFLLNECSSWDDLVLDWGFGAAGSGISDLVGWMDKKFLPSDKHWADLTKTQQFPL